jgi:hypothetical protein
MTKILGYDTTATMEALTAFIAQVSAQYEALEQAIAPVDEKIADLQKDWDPRPLAFWSEVLRKSIPAIRSATTGCLDLFGKKRSQATPVPIIICATSPGYTCDLHCIEEKIEEAGILLTAYLRTPESESMETRIRARQRMMRALQQLSKVVHEAVDNGRLKLKSAPEEQRKFLCHPMRQAPKESEPRLRVVDDQEQEGEGSRE